MSPRARQALSGDLSFECLTQAVRRGVRIAVAGRLSQGARPAAIRCEVLALLGGALAAGGLDAAEHRRLVVIARRAVDACLPRRGEDARSADHAAT